MTERTQLYLRDGDTAALESLARQLGLTVHRGRNTGMGNISHLIQLVADLHDDLATIELLERKLKYLRGQDEND